MDPEIWSEIWSSVVDTLRKESHLPHNLRAMRFFDLKIMDFAMPEHVAHHIIRYASTATGKDVEALLALYQKFGVLCAQKMEEENKKAEEGKG
ncbi:MAG: hypothetical protein WCO23_05220 [bacterium]